MVSWWHSHYRENFRNIPQTHRSMNSDTLFHVSLNEWHLFEIVMNCSGKNTITKINMSYLAIPIRCCSIFEFPRSQQRGTGALICFKTFAGQHLTTSQSLMAIRWIVKECIKNKQTLHYLLYNIFRDVGYLWIIL